MGGKRAKEARRQNKTQGVSGNPAQRAMEELLAKHKGTASSISIDARDGSFSMSGTTTPVSLGSVLRFLHFQRNTAISRNEIHKWDEFHLETLIKAGFAKHVVMPGLGAVPSEMMRDALISVGGEPDEIPESFFDNFGLFIGG